MSQRALYAVEHLKKGQFAGVLTSPALTNLCEMLISVKKATCTENDTTHEFTLGLAVDLYENDKLESPGKRVLQIVARLIYEIEFCADSRADLVFFECVGEELPPQHLVVDDIYGSDDRLHFTITTEDVNPTLISQ